jgi:hypothetical protein
VPGLGIGWRVMRGNRSGRVRVAAAVLACCVVGSALLSVEASARPRPTLSWALPHTAYEGSAITFSWQGKHLGRGHHLVIQKPEGTAHTWRSIMKLPSSLGSASLKGMPLGKYRFRIADLIGRQVLAYQTAGVAVFGEVSLSTLLRSAPQTATFPTFTFPYVVWWSTENGSSNPIFQVEENNCSSAHIAFVPSKTSTGSITLVQESREAITVSAPDNAIGSLDAPLTPGQSWAVNAGGNEDIHLNGYAICDSAG